MLKTPETDSKMSSELTDLKIEEIIALLKKSSENITHTFDLFYKNGKAKKVCEEHTTKMRSLFKILDELIQDIEHFQDDFEEVKYVL